LFAAINIQTCTDIAIIIIEFTTHAAIVLTPPAYYACTGERIEFTCTATGTTALQWIITVPGYTSENGVISSTQAVATISVQISSSVFILSRISTTPLTSTLSIRASPLINGTLVRCSAGNRGTDMAFITTLDIGKKNCSYMIIIIICEFHIIRYS
jgi:hypothetical protein